MWADLVHPYATVKGMYLLKIKQQTATCISTDCLLFFIKNREDIT